MGDPTTAHDLIYAANDARERAERERDEARAEVERLRYAHNELHTEVTRRLVPVFDSEIRWRDEAERLASALGSIANGRWNADTGGAEDVCTFARRVLRGERDYEKENPDG